MERALQFLAADIIFKWKAKTLVHVSGKFPYAKPLRADSHSRPWVGVESQHFTFTVYVMMSDFYLSDPASTHEWL